MKYALLIEYDGTAFAGWQIQPDVRTIQGELENALLQLTGTSLQIVGAGRTDAGVHSRGMTAHFQFVESDLEPYKLKAGLNALTGEDIVIRDVRTAGDDFHARYSAIWREYIYTVCEERSALARFRAFHDTGLLDIGILNDCAAAVLRTEDFTSFSKKTDDVDHYRCTVMVSQWRNDGSMHYYTIRANRFVRGMVRSLVGAMIECARGKISVEHFRQLLTVPTEEHRAKYIAPPQGLVLERVGYPTEYGLW
jgi:tRNA pseudouridine38-40 synthase